MTQSSFNQELQKREGFRSELCAAQAIAVRIWRVELSYPLSVLWFIAMPFVWLIPMLLTGNAVSGGPESVNLETLTGTSDWVSYVAIGTAVLGLTVSLMWGTANAFRREQNAGTLETLMTTPIKKGTLIWGALLHNIQHGGLGVVLQLVGSMLLFGVSLNIWGILPALAIIALMVIGMQGIVLTLVCVVLLAKQGWMVIEFLASGLTLLAPMAYPLAVFPPIIQYIATASPLTWSVDAFRNFLIFGLAGPAANQAVAALLILDTIYLLIGMVLFKRTEKYVRSKGALTQF
jgi:ABC-2 type transport system permease protein